MDDTGTQDIAPLKGVARIQAYLKTLPDAPGVYRMIDAKGDVLYVGKAKSLKKRVASYAKTGGHNERISRMIADTAEMLFVTTASETEALLLESNLIKRLKPRYNVSYRDDKSFPNILLREDHAFPQLLKHRGAQIDQGRLFRAVRERRRGQPHAEHAAARVPAALLFGLRCSSRARGRACCSRSSAAARPASGASTRPAIANWCARRSCSSTARAARCRTNLSQEMNEASEALDFEARRAAARSHPRDEPYPVDQGINPSTFAEADVFAALSAQGGETCIQVFFFRAGQNWGNRPYFPRHPRELSTGEVLEAFIGQFYDERTAPQLILLSDDIPERELLAEALSPCAPTARSRSPCRSAARSARSSRWRCSNAREQLGRRHGRELARSASCWKASPKSSAWRRRRKRIEVYDNSHIQGTQRGRRHDRRRAGRLREGRVPQVQHQIDRTHARRRLRA